MINTVNSFTATFTATAASSIQPTGTGDSTESSKSAQSQVADGQSVSSESQLRSQLNVQILQSSLEVSIQAGGKSQELVFRAAIDRINEQLAPSMGPDAIQGAMNQDNSPEATAGRILSLSTGFYDAYAARRSGDDPTQVAKDSSIWSAAVSRRDSMRHGTSSRGSTSSRAISQAA